MVTAQPGICSDRAAPAAEFQYRWADDMTRWFLLVSVVVIVAGCSTKCELNAGLSARTGSGATDCGHAALGGDASSVDACVVTAFKNRVAFVAQYDRQGTDSKVVFGIAADVNGTVTFLLWDGDPSGGSGADPVITGDLCFGPSVNSTQGRDPSTTPPLTCASSTSLGRTCG